jgi:hypothetical protein
MVIDECHDQQGNPSLAGVGCSREKDGLVQIEGGRFFLETPPKPGLVIGISPVPAKTLSTCWFKQPDMGIYR